MPKYLTIFPNEYHNSSSHKLFEENSIKTSEYIILTPVAPFKLYCFDSFVKNIFSFRPKPKEMVFCTEPKMMSEISKWKKEFKKQGIKLVILKLEPKIIEKFPEPSLKKVSYSREHLRHYFIDSPYKWALWLDCDIIPESGVARVLLNIAQSGRFLVVANEYLHREIEKKRVIISGIGCTLTHEAACRFARFMIASFIWDGEEGRCLADDFWFFAMLSAANWNINQQCGWNVQKKGRFVSTWHMPEQGPAKFLKKLKKNEARPRYK